QRRPPEVVEKSPRRESKGPFLRAQNRLSPVNRRKRYVPEIRIGQNEFDACFRAVALLLAEVGNNALRLIPCGNIQKLQPLSLDHGFGQRNGGSVRVDSEGVSVFIKSRGGRVLSR